MTIGPEPITRTRFRSVLRGISLWRWAFGNGTTGERVTAVRLSPIAYRLSPLFLDQLDEVVEQIVGIVRSRRRLGVVLHREDRLLRVAQTFDSAVIQVLVR